MKKMILVTAVAAMLASTVGCRCGGLFGRGAWFGRANSDVVCVDPCAPCAAPCPSPCMTGGCGAGPMTTPMITPGPETYVPAQ